MRRSAAVPSLAALVLAACGPLPTPEEEAAMGETQQPIINGTDCATDTETTSFGILLSATASMNGETGLIRSIICSGTLIAPDVVMIAAHCVNADVIGGGQATITDMKFSVTAQTDLSALAEGSSTTFPADAIAAKAWVANPQFNMDSTAAGPNQFNDVALLFLETPVPGVQPEVVVSAEEGSQLAQGNAVTIVGWGQQTVTTGYESPPPGTVGIKQCGQSFIGQLGTHEMQIGGDASSVRKCHGDSGGPTFMAVNTTWTTKRRVVGITSHSYDQTDCEKGGVDTRVDMYVSWIDMEMTTACKNGTRVWCNTQGVIPASWYEPLPGGGAKKGCGCGEAGVGLVALLPLLGRRRAGARS